MEIYKKLFRMDSKIIELDIFSHSRAFILISKRI
jgi:hypothetical protein